MNIQELIDYLSLYDGETEVVCYSDDTYHHALKPYVYKQLMYRPLTDTDAPGYYHDPDDSGAAVGSHLVRTDVVVLNFPRAEAEHLENID